MSKFSFWVKVTEEDIARYRAGEISCPVEIAMKRAAMLTFRTHKIRVRNGFLQVWTTNNANNFSWWNSWYPTPRGRKLAETCRAYRLLSPQLKRFKMEDVSPTMFLLSES